MQKENKILLPVINKIYKEDYKNYRECAKKTLLLRKENHPLIVKYNKELTYFFDLPENDFLEKNNSSELLNNNELQTINSEPVLDGIETRYHAKQYFIRNYNCFDFDDYDRHLGGKMTIEKIQDSSIDILFEAQFEYNDCVTKPDILKRNGTGWDLIEVKATTKVHREHFYDVLYQYYILTNCNIEIKNIYLMHLNSNYIHQFALDYDSLFTLTNDYDLTTTGAKQENIMNGIQKDLRKRDFNEDIKQIKNIFQMPVDKILAWLKTSQCHK